MERELVILYGCDDNYAPYAGISMASLFESNRNAQAITIYVAGMGISAENMDRMRELARLYQRKIVFLDTEKAFEEIKRYQCKGWNGSLATWLRFFVLEQIPQKYSRLLYLDSDTIVQGDLQPLFKLDMGNKAMGAICDSICIQSREQLGLDISEPYFNAGVLLVNLSFWRKKDLLRRMMAHLQKNVDQYGANDQDLLNDFFKGQILRLPIEYNLQGTHLAYATKDYFSVYSWGNGAYYTQEEVENGKKAPKVVHFFRFLGDYPWEGEPNYHPAKQLYLEWKARSPWKDLETAPSNKKSIFKVEKLLYQMLPPGYFLRLFHLVKRGGIGRRKRVKG